MQTSICNIALLCGMESEPTTTDGFLSGEKAWGYVRRKVGKGGRVGSGCREMPRSGGCREGVGTSLTKRLRSPGVNKAGDQRRKPKDAFINIGVHLSPHHAAHVVASGGTRDAQSGRKGYLFPLACT